PAYATYRSPSPPRTGSGFLRRFGTPRRRRSPRRRATDMASAQLLKAEFERRAREEQSKFTQDGLMTTWGEACVRVGLWANTPHSAVWQLDTGREVRITWGDLRGRGPDDAAIVLHQDGHLIKRWGLPPGLHADQFFDAVERFIKEARGL